MVTVKSVEIGYGAVSFNNEVEAVPATSHRNGNVTIENPARKGSPSYFEGSFMLSAEVEVEGAVAHNIFHLKAVVPGLPKDAPYAQVETAAYEQLAPMLRAFAQKLDDQAKESDEAGASGST